MLDDIRPLVADLLEGLGDRQPLDREGNEACLRLYEQARTLRWCHERETTPSDDEVAELDRLREVVYSVEDILDGSASGKVRPHPATVLKEIRAALGDLS